MTPTTTHVVCAAQAISSASDGRWQYSRHRGGDGVRLILRTPRAFHTRLSSLGSLDLESDSPPEVATSTQYVFGTALRPSPPAYTVDLCRQATLDATRTTLMMATSMLPIPVPRVAARQYVPNVHMNGMSPLYRYRMAGATIPIARFRRSSVC